MSKLNGKKVAVLVEDGFEQVEMTSPVERLKKEGATVSIISPKGAGAKVKGWQHDTWGDEFDVDVDLASANESEYDALVLPGGVMNPDKLRKNDNAVSFVKSFFESKKPIGAICHGPWTLVEAGVVDGKKMTSYDSIKTDIKNAGGNWVDREVVVDQGLVTSRNPDDLPAFNDKLVEEIAEGIHNRRSLESTALEA